MNGSCCFAALIVSGAIAAAAASTACLDATCSSVTVGAQADLPGPAIDVYPDGRHASCLEAWAAFSPGSVRPAVLFGLGDDVPGLGGFVVTCDVHGLHVHVFTPDDVTLDANVGCATGAFGHIALCFDNGRVELYVDGEPKDAKEATPVPTSAVLHLGSFGQYPTDATTTLDEVRFSTGHRYTGAFTPAHHLIADEDTRLLFHFDESKGRVVYDAAAGAKVTLPQGVELQNKCPP